MVLTEVEDITQVFPTPFISAEFCQTTLNFVLLKNLKVHFYPVFPDIRKSIAFFESSQFLPSRPSDKSTIQIKLINSNGGMILTGRNRSTLTSACHRATWSTTCLLGTGQGETG
jgi:hypothetical protein